ncbi:MAG: MFS transporter [Chloroflexi bacterium]|nr:MFS transporter [Chloroflexota bacterium]
MKMNRKFTFWRLLRLSSFQIGSAMGDILVTSIWNRVMISNFGIPATPVGLLIALRYLLSPLSLLAGYWSDTRPLWGYRRTSYIWLGRGLMVLSLPLLGLSLMRLGVVTTDVLGWLLALASSLMYGIGTLVSGSPFLALVRDAAPPEKQGLAISTVETVLIIFFAIAGIGFSVWMDVYSAPVFWEMVITTMAVGGFFWFFAIAGAEKRQKKGDVTETAVSTPINNPPSRPSSAKSGKTHAPAASSSSWLWRPWLPGHRTPFWSRLARMCSICPSAGRHDLTAIGKPLPWSHWLAAAISGANARRNGRPPSPNGAWASWLWG